jgi:aminoglycoside phosphotransferase (APT) family kinase protein
MSGTSAPVPDGIDAERVTDWLVTHTPPVEPPLTFDLIAGGRSNLTYLVTDAAGRKLVLRRPPLSHVLASAHDMGREHRIISALRDSPVPVPGALGYCEDEAVNGRPFYVMAFVEGHIFRMAQQVEGVLDEATRRRAAENLIDVLVALHEVDVTGVGLADLARHDAYLARQLKRWHGQFQRSQDQEREAGVFRPAEIIDEVHATLVDKMPEQQGVAIVHGDYRLDNCVVGDDGTVQAVLDWELCTLGDPLADVGTLLIYWADKGETSDIGVPMSSTALDGFPTRAELSALYAQRSSLDLTPLPYYVAFGHWKLACIMEGVFARFAAGAMGQSGEGAELMAGMVIQRAKMAAKVLADL